MDVLSHILQHRIIAIVRGANPDDMPGIVDALYAGGIRSLEVTINSPDAIAMIKKIADERSDKILVGAGTVLDPETAREALLAGAKYIISPVMNPETIRMTKRYGAISIPGAYTATEILQAYEYGGDIIKVFPASVGPQYFKEIRGPLPHIPLMPTGGVTLDNIAFFKEAGAVAFGLGSALVNTSQRTTPESLKELEEKAKKFIAAVSD